MGILNIPPRELYPKKPYNTIFSNQLNVSAYGTVLDITSGRGVVTTVIAGSQDVSTSSWRSPANLRYRITIDGVETIVTGSFPELIATTPSSVTVKQFLLNTPLYFYRTCKIEVQNHQNAFDLIYCTVQYALE